MSAHKGNQYAKGNKGGGRRTLTEEVIKKAQKLYAEDLAKSVITKHLTAMNEDDKSSSQEVKDIAMPIYLKTKAEKVDITSKGKQIIGMEIKKDGGEEVVPNAS